MIISGIVGLFHKIITKAKQDTLKEYENIIKKSKEEIIDSYKKGKIEIENSITDRLLQNIEKAVNNMRLEHEDFEISARTFSDKGEGSSEKKYGADFCVVLNCDTKKIKIDKGFLVQAKRADTNKSKHNGLQVIVGKKNLRKLVVRKPKNKIKLQLAKMLNHTPDSFMVVYDYNDIITIPASSYNGLKKAGELYAKSLEQFFGEFMMCFIGDHRIFGYSDDIFDNLRNKLSVRYLLQIRICNRKNLN